MFDYILIQALNGLVIGVIYAVIAAGLTVIFSILKMVNFAHGEVYMMGGYFAYFAIALLGLPPFAAVVAAMLLSFALSVLVERTLLTPLYSPTTERKGDYGILVTFGISILLRNLAIIVFGPFPLRPPSFFSGSLVVGSFVMSWDRVFAAGAGMAMLFGLVLFLRRSAWGEALNAVSQSRESAAIVGINDRLVYMLAFGLGGALAGGAGALVGPIYSLSPSMGLVPDTQAFAIVILGGMGSVGGSMIAGLLIGVSEGHVRRTVSRSEPQPDLRAGVQPADPYGGAADPPDRVLRPRPRGDGVARAVVQYRRRGSDRGVGSGVPRSGRTAIGRPSASWRSSTRSSRRAGRCWSAMPGSSRSARWRFVSLGAYTFGAAGAVAGRSDPARHGRRRGAVRHGGRRHRLRLPAHARPVSGDLHHGVLRGAAHRDR